MEQDPSTEANSHSPSKYAFKYYGLRRLSLSIKPNIVRFPRPDEHSQTSMACLFKTVLNIISSDVI